MALERQYGQLVLVQHGVKGQRWGVRKSYSQVIKSLSDKDSKFNSKNYYRVSDKKETLKNTYNYVSTNKKDHNEYVGNYAQLLNKAYSIKMTSSSAFVSPSTRKRVEAFVSLYKSDPMVKKSLVDNHKNIHILKSLVFGKKHFDKMYSKMDDVKLVKKAYKDFAADLALDRKLGNKYINTFKKKGYNSIIDDNDRLNGYSKSPLIVFDMAKNLKVSDYHKLNEKEMNAAFNKSLDEQMKNPQKKVKL